MVFCVENHFGKQGSAGRKFAETVVGGSLHIIASVLIVKTDTGSDDFLVEFGEVEVSEGLIELFFKKIDVGWNDMIAFSDIFLEFD